MFKNKNKDKEILKKLERSKDLIEASLVKQIEIIRDFEEISKRLVYIQRIFYRNVFLCIKIFSLGVILGFLIAKIL